MNANSPEEMADCITAFEGPKNVSVLIGAINKVNVDPVKKNQIKNISRLHQFQFHEDHIQAWEIPQIGIGEKFSPQKIDNVASYEFTIKQKREGKLIPNKKGSVDKPMEIRGLNQDEEGAEKVWQCPNVWCGMPLMDRKRYEVHLLEKSCPSKPSYLDFGKMLYKDKNGIRNDRVRASSYKQSRNIRSNNKDLAKIAIEWRPLAKQQLTKGFALPPRKKIIRRTEMQKKFLRRIFNEGIKKKGKERQARLSVENVAAKMREEKDENGDRVFTQTKNGGWLTPAQIQSDFSRMAAKNKHKGQAIAEFEGDIEEESDEVNALIEDQISAMEEENLANVEEKWMEIAKAQEEDKEHPLVYHEVNFCQLASNFKKENSLTVSRLSAMETEKREAILKTIGHLYTGNDLKFMKKIVEFVEKTCGDPDCQSTALFTLEAEISSDDDNDDEVPFF